MRAETTFRELLETDPKAFILTVWAISKSYVGINSCQSRLAIPVILVMEKLPAPRSTEEVLSVGATRSSSASHTHQRDVDVITNLKKISNWVAKCNVTLDTCHGVEPTPVYQFCSDRNMMQLRSTC